MCLRIGSEPTGRVVRLLYRGFGGRMKAATESEARVQLEDVHLSLGGRAIFSGLTANFPRGRISVILGGSGAGKSTLLRAIGGLVRPQRGVVRVAGEDVTVLPERDLFRVRERIGMLFQHGALLDSMSVYENVALPLREHTKLSERDIASEVERRLEAVGLPDAARLFPRELSGGMLRRAALARAIVTEPEIVLCDEPFSGLDPINVRRIEKLFTQLNRQLHLSLLVTSHHIPSSLRMADQIVFLQDGNAVVGSPKEVRYHPDARVAAFFAAELDADAETGDGERAQGGSPS
jgi:phospholipid/cholesterol/gamma-HCH transport system ATP-binding protein